MSAYIIVRANIVNPEKFKEYLRLTPEIISRFGGRHIVRGGDMITLEGPDENRRIVIIEFSNMEQAKKFYNSPEYNKAKKIREGAAEGQMILVDGIV